MGIYYLSKSTRNYQCSGHFIILLQLYRFKKFTIE